MQDPIDQILAMIQQQRFDAAARLAEQQLVNDPDNLDLHRLAGTIAIAESRGRDAIPHFSRLTVASAATATDFFRIGQAYTLCGRGDLASQAFLQYLRQKPDDALAWQEYGKALGADGQSIAATQALTEALKRNPDLDHAWAALAGVRLLLADAPGAVAAAEKAITLAPEQNGWWSALLTTLQYIDGMTPETLLAFHRRAAPSFGPDIRTSMAGKPRGGRKLRIGFLSANYKMHPVGWFLWPLFQYIDKNRAEICVFSASQNRATDPQQIRLKEAAHEWHDIQALSVADLQAYLRHADLDILIDNGGHRAWNRMAVMAGRTAPVQISWLESIGTTGILNMDAIIADPWHVPFGEDASYCEEVLRLPHVYTCIAFPEAPPGPLPDHMPRDNAGHITFGSISLPGKFNAGLIETWSQILKAVPGSQLFLKYKGLGQEDLQRHISKKFVANGVDASRILFEDYSPYPKSLSRYRDVIDIALDPFPYTGGLTTLEAAWMGCPAIALRGTVFAGRHSNSYLENMGLADCIAPDRQGYIALAVSLANDPAKLRNLRQRMRPAITASPMMQHQQWSDDFLAAMEEIYDRKTATISD